MSDIAQLQTIVEGAFEKRDTIGPSTSGEVREAVEAALDLLDSGALRVAERDAQNFWRVNQWLKKAVLLSFRLSDMSVVPGGPGDSAWWDKVPTKFQGWGENRALADDDPLRQLGAGADETIIIDDDRAGLQRLQHAADAGAARDVATLADLGA